MSVVVQLRTGWRRGDHAARQVEVRAPTGRDEMQLEEAALMPAAWANRLLAACVADQRTNNPIGLNDVHGLGIGDRERLLLAIHAATFGRSADLLYRCTRCREVAEVTIDLTSFLTAPVESPAEPEKPIVVAIDGETAPMSYRMPTAGDLEAIAPLATTDPDAAAAELIGRLSVATAGEVPSRLAEHETPGEASDALAAEIAGREPDTTIFLSVVCPTCGVAVEALLDATNLLRARFAGGRGIFAEVDRLARIYHWSEADILALPYARRQRYLGLAAQEAAQ